MECDVSCLVGWVKQEGAMAQQSVSLIVEEEGEI